MESPDLSQLYKGSRYRRWQRLHPLAERKRCFKSRDSARGVEFIGSSNPLEGGSLVSLQNTGVHLHRLPDKCCCQSLVLVMGTEDDPRHWFLGEKDLRFAWMVTNRPGGTRTNNSFRQRLGLITRQHYKNTFF